MEDPIVRYLFLAIYTGPYVLFFIAEAHFFSML